MKRGWWATGAEPLDTLAIFGKPGFEEYLRDVSVAPTIKGKIGLN
ncbi:MAG TPA: hypothetical protein VGC48_00460 [Gemmatimonadales bacterium]